MKNWPVPNSYSKEIPAADSPGSFWENRGDRYHCGVDIYASKGSEVLSIEDGEVIDVGIFTSPDELSYWNKTFYILIQNNTGLVCKYAELGNVTINKGDFVKAGQLIGHIGLVLNPKQIDKTSPLYIQNINRNHNHSMLHFELFSSLPDQSDKYLGGNWFGDSKPRNLIDPSNYLRYTEKI